MVETLKSIKKLETKMLWFRYCKTKFTLYNLMGKQFTGNAKGKHIF